MARARDVILASAALVLLCVPMVFSVGEGSEFSTSENRRLAALPRVPRNLAELSAFPGRVDASLRDHLGLRDWVSWAYATARFRLLRAGNDKVLLGRDGWLFYRGENGLEKSAGLYRGVDEVAHTVAMLAVMQRDLAQQGAQLLVAVPPSKATIEAEALPEWARNHGTATQYDLTLEALRERGIPALDLRPVLRAGASGAVYHHYDTHWTPRAAVTAVNAILAWRDAGWRVDPAAVLGPAERKVGGDESKVLGLGDQVSEQIEPLLLPHRPMAEALDQLRYRETGGRVGGRRIAILGDSFTYSLFAPVLLPGLGELMWVPYRSCWFDWSLVTDFRPDEVWWMPAERLIACPVQAWPAGLDRG